MKKIFLLVVTIITLCACANSNNSQSEEATSEETTCCGEGECKEGECELEKGDNPGAKAIAILKDAIKKMNAATSLEELESIDNDNNEKMAAIDQEGEEWAEKLEKEDPAKFQKFEEKIQALTKELIEVTTKKMGEFTGQAIDGLDPEAE